MAVDIESYSSAPLISSDPAVLYPAIQTFWHDVHRLINVNRPPETIVYDILRLIGLSMGADRAYTFSVTANQAFSSCTNEWTRLPEYELRPMLQGIDQRGLKGWLNRFEQNTTICIEDVAHPPAGLEQPAAKFERDLIKSIYVFGFYDEGRLIGYLGLDYVTRTWKLGDLAKEQMLQLASTLNLFILRHEALELWNQTATSLPSAMFIKDAANDLRYIYANPKYLSLYGSSVVGKTDLEIFGPENGDLFREQDAECLRTGKPFRYDGPQYDYSRVAKGYYSTTKYPVTTKMGRHYIAGFISDITAEHDLRMQALELLEKAKEAEKAKGIFLAAMSHEIRTPLNAIIGLVDELRHTDIPEETRAEYVAAAGSASRALLALINDVLDISKLDSGQMHMTPVETDLVLLLAECKSIFGETCNGKGLSYSCEVSSNLPIVIVDMTRLRQILLNLIGNAVKFTETGGIYVYGKFERTTAKTGTLVLEVADTGIGISPEDQKTVFGLFEQASRIRGSHLANKGTGLGLCLCKRLASCMNGDIRLSSAVGRGSTFHVILRDLPYVERSESSDVVRHRKDQTIRIHSVSLESRVLVVDDVPMNLKVLGIILRRMNVDAILAGNAREALEILGRGGITHVLTDIWMPDMNGEELARRIRANPAWTHVRVAAQTADVEASDNFDTRLFDAVLSKPLTPEKVYAFLQGKAPAKKQA